MSDFVVPFTNGRSFVTPSYEEAPHGCPWLAVRDKNGEELWRSVSADWAADPVAAITALATALTGDRAQAPPAADPDYGPECAATVLASGVQIRFAAAGLEADYVRVVDRNGDELVYWISDEFEDDTQFVLGALSGSLNTTLRILS